MSSAPPLTGLSLHPTFCHGPARRDSTQSDMPSIHKTHRPHTGRTLIRVNRGALGHKPRPSWKDLASRIPGVPALPFPGDTDNSQYTSCQMDLSHPPAPQACPWRSWKAKWPGPPKGPAGTSAQHGHESDPQGGALAPDYRPLT